MAAVNKDTITRGLRYSIATGNWGMQGTAGMRAGVSQVCHWVGHWHCVICVVASAEVRQLSTISTVLHSEPSHGSVPLTGNVFMCAVVSVEVHQRSTISIVLHSEPSHGSCALQVLNRLTYASTLSHLRRISSPIGREGKLAKPRQLHNSQVRLL